MHKEEHVQKFSSLILELIFRLENTGHVVSEIQQKQVLLQGLPRDYEKNAETVMKLKQAYNAAVARLAFPEKRLCNSAKAFIMAFVTPNTTLKLSRSFFS